MKNNNNKTKAKQTHKHEKDDLLSLNPSNAEAKTSETMKMNFFICSFMRTRRHAGKI